MRKPPTPESSDSRPISTIRAVQGSWSERAADDPRKKVAPPITPYRLLRRPRWSCGGPDGLEKDYLWTRRVPEHLPFPYFEIYKYIFFLWAALNFYSGYPSLWWKQNTILAVGIYAKKKKVHLLTRNVHNTAYKQPDTWYDLCGPQLQRPSFWASICKEI